MSTIISWSEQNIDRQQQTIWGRYSDFISLLVSVFAYSVFGEVQFKFIFTLRSSGR